MATYNRPGVYVTERLLPAQVVSGGTAQAAGAVIAPFAKGPSTLKLVSSWYEFTKYFGGYNAAYPATFQVGAFFQNGGRDLYVCRMLASDASNALVAIGRASGAGTVLTVTAKNKGMDGTNLRVKLSAGSFGTGFYDFTVYLEQVAGTSSDVSNDLVLENYENVVLNSTTSTDYLPNVVNLVSEYVTVAVSDNTNAPSLAVFPLGGTGLDGGALTLGAYTDTSTGPAVKLAAIDRPLVIFMPALWTTITESDADDVYSTMAAFAASNGKHYVVAETKAGLIPSAAISAAGLLGITSHEAVYYPHYYISDPVGRSSSAIRLIGPSGAVAGIYMNTDATTGPFKAPAGLGTTVQGAIAVERAFTNTELDSLNSATSPVNPIRQIPGAGISVMGARTLKQDGTANKYVNMRRSLIYLNKALSDATQFAMFENNDERLWARINTKLVSILNDYRNQGGLRGVTPAESFFVKCDAENNTEALIAQGQVNIEVGVALQYPAEFVVITLSQKTLV
jgi:phage tail sheath protein FI